MADVMHTPGRAKPRIPAKTAPVLCEIDRYIRRYNLRGNAMRSAASDVCDGWLIRGEIEPLIRRRLLTVVRFDDGEFSDYEALCGRTFTVALTDRALRCLWPDRAGVASITKTKVSTQ